MKYERIAQGRHFFDFVFYETDKKSLYTYCPNCGCEHKEDIKSIVPRGERERVKWIKEHYKPCDCFAYTGRQPKYLNSAYEYSKAQTFIDIGEFCKNPDGSVTLNVYRHTASFATSEYCCSRPFYRRPNFSYENTIEMVFREGQKTKIKTCLYNPIMSRYISVGSYWEEVKNWRQTFCFEIIEDSLEELKGTFLEQYIQDINKFTVALEKPFNIEQAPMGDYTAMFLIKMVESPAVKKLWRLGYYGLVINKVFESLMPKGNPYVNTYGLCGSYYTVKRSGTTINWGGRKLENILKCNPQKLDLISDREELTVVEVKAGRILEQEGIELNCMNAEIVNATYYEKLQAIFKAQNIQLSKMFKYIRHTKNKSKQNLRYSEIVTDYYDYLDKIQKLNIRLTADVVFPSDLIRAHARAVSEHQISENKEKIKVFKKATEKYKLLNFEGEKYKIAVINSSAKLIEAATHLHNCAGGYVDRIIHGSSVIFLIRAKKPKQPFYMLELNPKNLTIVQNRGMRNCSAPEEVRKFAEEWLKSVILPKSKVLSTA